MSKTLFSAGSNLMEDQDKIKDELNKQLAQELYTLETITEFTRILNSAKNLRKVFDALLLTLMGHKGIEVIALFTNEDLDSNFFQLCAWKGSEKKVKKKPLYFSSDVLQSLEEHHFLKLDDHLQKEETETLASLKLLNCHLILPISFQENVIGIISCSQKITTAEYSENDLKFLKLISDHAGIAIHNIMTLETLRKNNLELEKKVFELEAVEEISRSLTSSIETKEISHGFLITVAGFLTSETGTLYLQNQGKVGGNYQYIGHVGLYPSFLPPSLFFEKETVEWLKEQKFIQNSSDLPDELDLFFRKFKIELCFPLTYSDQLLGLSFFGEKATGLAYQENRLELASVLVVQAISPIRNSQYYLELKKSNEALKNRTRELEVTNHKITQEILEREKAEKEVIRLNNELEIRVVERTAELRNTVEQLQKTQKGLVQSEKMASLGKLTAAIAHEIKNPLNFINNFADLSVDIVQDLKEELAPFVNKLEEGEQEKIEENLEDLEKAANIINHNGKRADSIISSMLEHSRRRSGERKLTDINALLKEYLDLTYYGICSQDTEFSANLETVFDESIELIIVVPQELGRVFLSIFNNAFYALREKQKSVALSYIPFLSVKTKQRAGTLEIKIKDNGLGIPQKSLSDIFNPFFTTKPAGKGTGLGLSVSYDIIVNRHHGDLKVETKEGEFTQFSITLPSQNPESF